MASSATEARAQVVVVEDRPLVAAAHQVGGQGWLPDALGEPGAAWPPAEARSELVAHAPELRDAVGDGQRDKDGFGPAAAEDLDLAAVGEGRQAFDRPRLLGHQPLEEGTAVVQADPDARMPLERGEHRLVGGPEGVLDDPAEVAHRLVVVDHEGERDTRDHATGSSPWVGLRAGRRIRAA